MELKPVFFNKSTASPIEYYNLPSAFNEEQLNWINNLKNLFPIEKANTVGPTEESVRNSHIRWIDYTEKSAWLYDHLSEIIEIANNEMWNFNISHISDSIQYTEYHDNGGHYNWHTDVGLPPVNHRKISITIQLSDPNDYEGGDLELWTGGDFQTMPKQKGEAILFPSFLLHRVTPVTKGVRKSLVLWVGGSPYK